MSNDLKLQEQKTQFLLAVLFPGIIADFRIVQVKNLLLMRHRAYYIMFRLAFDLQIAPVATQCLEHLKHQLEVVCKNPKVPGFNHYLFESVAALISNSAAADTKTMVDLEQRLFSPFQIVLQNDVQVSSLVARSVATVFEITMSH